MFALKDKECQTGFFKNPTIGIYKRYIEKIDSEKPKRGEHKHKTKVIKPEKEQRRNKESTGKQDLKWQ